MPARRPHAQLFKHGGHETAGRVVRVRSTRARRGCAIPVDAFRRHSFMEEHRQAQTRRSMGNTDVSAIESDDRRRGFGLTGAPVAQRARGLRAAETQSVAAFLPCSAPVRMQ